MKTKKLMTGVLFAVLLAVGAFSAHAMVTGDGAKESTGSPDIVARKCPPFC